MEMEVEEPQFSFQDLLTQMAIDEIEEAEAAEVSMVKEFSPFDPFDMLTDMAIQDSKKPSFTDVMTHLAMQ